MNQKAADNHLQEIEIKIKRLNDLCMAIDPFTPLSDELKARLLDEEIDDFSDPFKITNALILKLENAIEDLEISHEKIN